MKADQTIWIIWIVVLLDESHVSRLADAIISLLIVMSVAARRSWMMKNGLRTPAFQIRRWVFQLQNFTFDQQKYHWGHWPKLFPAWVLIWLTSTEFPPPRKVSLKYSSEAGNATSEMTIVPQQIGWCNLQVINPCNCVCARSLLVPNFDAWSVDQSFPNENSDLGDPGNPLAISHSHSYLIYM